MKQPHRIVVTIDRLILKGVAAKDVTAVSSALHESLSHELATKGLSIDASVALPSVPHQTFPTQDTGRELGLTAGQSIHKAMGQGVKGGQV